MKTFEEGDSFGIYRVVRRLGKGGMGEVWLLRSPSGEEVAAKILDDSLSADHEARKRFLREAELAMGVKHPNLVETYDIGEDPDTGLCYILMEYMPGGTLADYIKSNGALEIDYAVAVVSAIAAALELARQNGIVHRDIKPANIMFDMDGTPKLADLGIARSGTSDSETTTLTQTGVMIGTPAYMAPEQMLDAHHVDTRADIYSLGVVFYEMLTGERPNKDDTVVQILAKAVKGEPIPDVRTLRPEVSASLAQLLNMMVVPDKDGRISTPGQITNAIDIIARTGGCEIQVVVPGEASAKRSATGNLLVSPKRLLASLVETTAKRKKTKAVLLALGLVTCLAAGLAGIAYHAFHRYVDDFRPSDAKNVTVLTNIVEKTVVVTNDVGVSSTAGSRAEKEVASGDLHRMKSRRAVDRRVRFAKIGDHVWFYTLEDDDAVIWRGQNGFDSETRAAVAPSDDVHLEVPSELDGHKVKAIGNLAFIRCGKLKSVTIPEGVREVRGSAFLFCSSLESISLPRSISTIRGRAFSYCGALVDVDINQCTSVQGNSFCFCDRLASVKAAPDNAAYVSVDGALYSKDMRTLVFYPRVCDAVHIPETVRNIGEGAFDGCRMIREITLPDGIEHIASSAFSDCSSVKVFIAPKTLRSMGSSVFSRCKQLERVVFQAGLRELGHSLFGSCLNLRRIEFNGDAPVVDLSRQTVLGKTPESLVIVVKKGSKGWSSPGSTALPELWPVGVFIDDSRPIRFQEDLLAQTGSQSVEPIADGHEKFTKDDFKVKIAGVAVVDNDMSVNSYRNMRFFVPETRLVVPFGKKAVFLMEYDFPTLYKSHISIRDDRLDSGKRAPDRYFVSHGSRPYKGKGIGCGCLSLSDKCNIETCNLKSVALVIKPEFVEDVQQAIYSSAPVNLVFMGKGGPAIGVDKEDGNAVQKASDAKSTDRSPRHAKIDGTTWTYRIVDGCAFLMCEESRALLSVPCVDPAPKGVLKIPSQIDGCPVTAIGTWAFNKCDAITEVHVPESVTRIDYGAFCNCRNLQSAFLPSNLSGEFAEAFKYCNKLSKISFTKTNPHYNIYNGDVYSGDKMTLIMMARDGRDSFEFPKTVQKISSHAFEGTSIKSLEIPRWVREIGSSAFFGCNNLVEVTFNGVVERMGTYIFAYSSLERISFPDGMKSIPDGTFRSCSRLKEVSLPDTIERIEGHATFEGCSSLVELHLPKRLQVLGESQLFNHCKSLERLVVPASVNAMSGDSGTFRGCSRFRELVFEGNAPRLTGRGHTLKGRPGAGQMFDGAPGNVQVVVKPDSVGWAGDNSRTLPEKWPVNGGEGARRIVYSSSLPTGDIRDIPSLRKRNNR